MSEWTLVFLIINQIKKNEEENVNSSFGLHISACYGSGKW